MSERANNTTAMSRDFESYMGDSIFSEEELEGIIVGCFACLPAENILPAINYAQSLLNPSEPIDHSYVEQMQKTLNVPKIIATAAKMVL